MHGREPELHDAGPTPGGWPAARWLRAAARRDRVVWLVGCLVLYSLAVYVLVLRLGFHGTPIDGIGYRPYFARPNWWGFPLFFLFVAPALWLSWTPFLGAWAKLAETDVLRVGEGAPDPALVADLRGYIASKRWIAVALALLTSLAINAIDLAPVYRAYTVDEPAARLAWACRRPDFFSKWLLDAWSEPPAPEGCAAPCSRPDGDGAAPVVAACALPILADRLAGRSAPPAQLAVTAAAYLQQFAVVALACLGVLQLLLHAALFALFDHLAFARKHGLRLRLNAASPLRELGLEHWNHALNNVYWAMAPALVIPVISRLDAPSPELYAPGQRMFTGAIPLVVLAPIVATIISRQVRLPEVWERLRPRGPVDPQDYLDQRLWPLDKNWASKLGILLAAFLASLMLGIEVSKIMAL
ncbi:MAG TPA: hypothetical protein VFG47_07905 [Geminicoccaceae bacterium]|nr:hypothetical protein [Geminicoccaceae bacterium]